MSTLSGSNISQTYEGLLKMTDSTSGVTGTLQTVQTGDGTNTPLQISQTAVNISGSLTVNGSPISIDTGSLVTTSSFNAFTSSVDIRFDGIEIETGSLQNQINQKLDTGSFNSYTSSNDSKVNSLISNTGSYATTSSLTSVSQSVAVTDLSQDNRLTSIESITGSFATTGSLNSYTLTSSFNSYTSSNDTKVNDLISKTGSYATTGSNDFVGQQRINGNLIVTGSITSTQEVNAGNGVYTSFVQGQSALNLNATNFVDIKSNTSGVSKKVRIYNNNADKNVPVEITGSLNVTGEITALSASITYLETIYQTSSVIFSSGSNILGDEAGDTQTLYGTVNLPNGPLNVTGNTLLNGNVDITTGNLNVYSPLARFSGSSVIVTGSVDVTDGITGSLEGTASYATQALSASFAPMPDVSYFATTGSNTFTGQQNIETNLNVTQSLIVGGNSTFDGQTTYNDTIQYNADSFIKSGSQINFNIGDGQDGKFYRLSRKVGGEFGIVEDPGNYHLLDISSSFANFLPKTSFQNGVDITGSLNVRSGSLSTISNNTTININNYLTSSLGGQSNIIKGWWDNPTSAGPQSNINNYTGSVTINGSNNTLSMPQIRATAVGGSADMQGYISGSDNTIATNAGGIYLNTGSLIFPKITNNYVGATSNIRMTFTTSSLAGTAPSINNNTLYAGALIINSNSGSLQTAAGNLFNGGNLTSTQNFVTNTRPLIATNLMNGAAVTLNHISSSINYNGNIHNAPVTVNNHLSSSIAQNTLSVTNNTFLGGSSNTFHQIFASGSQSTNITRTIADNLIGGRSTSVTSSFVGSNNSNLLSSLIYGQALFVSGNHPTTNGGSAFLGRYNDTTSGLNSVQDIVFAVGTGTSNVSRKTGLYVTSGSLVGVSGSMLVQGNTSIQGLTNVLTVTGSATIQHSIAGQPALTVIAQGTGQPALTITGSLNVTSSGDHNIVGNSTNVTGPFNVNGNTQLTGSLRVTGDVLFSSGSNTTMGLAVLDGGSPSSVVVSNSLVTSNSLIFLTKQTLTNHASVSITSKGSGTFTIGSSHNGDTDTVAYLIINPA